MSQIAHISNTQRQELIHTIEQIWDTYYHIGETQDLAFNMGKLLSKIQAYNDAIFYFQQSLKLNGIQPAVLYHLGLCYFHLKKQNAALYCIHQALSIEPTFTDAQELLTEIKITK
ncbi:tetratricopeptide repeat protein [Leptolyngbya sp. FACHB-16]|uniref:tetratricopeptide repeat protein n=1 Tax=unclassified Leptolyngbya TaxID=2650499 RepID=UPI0016831530|nr:tetratricopeptide repeat protein [Leptolyngbya sp. FACHB-16]MBD2153112.1 tetratricopeptide repeat protein [Leptolyngbya sp. FACHB-16]